MTDQQQPQRPRRTSFVDLVDVAGLAGAGLIVYGVHLINRPCGFIVAGLFLLAAAWKLAARSAG